MSKIDNVLIQVRARLTQLSIKLWLEPYYEPESGSVEASIDVLAHEFSKVLSLPVEMCKMALQELQEGAIRKLAAREEFERTGMATFTVRRVKNIEGTQSSTDVKCALSANGSELLEKIADSFSLDNATRIKCIAGGKIIDADFSLQDQGLKNNQHLLIITSEPDNSSKDALYDRIHKIKADVVTIIDSNQQLFEMEDQDGNPVYLPPTENRALLMGMGFYEKARAAIKRQCYDEALILLLEADEHFASCNSQFLQSVDNYALVNLDIVWCYLCLKNVSQLPDAERRLKICEDNFRRSYGENNERLIAVRGTAFLERALIMRLHLLQGIVCFHQNSRDEAYLKLEAAAEELNELKVDEDSVQQLVDMGFESKEARIGLRAASGSLNKAMDFIYEHQSKIHESRRRAEKERESKRFLGPNSCDTNWVNPRTAHNLLEMGFARNLVVAALRRTNNDLNAALNLLQTRSDELVTDVAPEAVNDTLMKQLIALGFDNNIVCMALEVSQNDLERALEFLFDSCENQRNDFIKKIARMDEVDQSGPSTSTANHISDVARIAINRAKKEMESLRAYNRFNVDVSRNSHDYLDLSLEEEEKFLNEYMRLLHS